MRHPKDSLIKEAPSKDTTQMKHPVKEEVSAICE